MRRNNGSWDWEKCGRLAKLFWVHLVISLEGVPEQKLWRDLRSAHRFPDRESEYAVEL